MERLLLSVIILVCVSFVGKAQLLGSHEQKYCPLNWHELSFDRDSVYGLELDRAYEFLKGKKKKQKVVVAIIDGGFDYQHEDLKEVVWTNKDEVAGNQLDDDRNGYTDDIHGWNFLVTKDGKAVVRTMDEAAKLFLQKQDRYDVLFNKARNAEEEKEYQALKKMFEKSDLGMKYISVGMTHLLKKYIEEYDREMRSRFPGETLTQQHFAKVLDEKETDTLKVTTHIFYNMMWGMRPNATWEELFAGRLESIRMAQQEYETLLAQQVDERMLIGDDMEDIRDNRYGSPELLTEDAEHGTHIAGIIGARRGNGIGIDGIADQVELMLISAIPGGDENDKDVALAIRYAVDKGAKIINLSFGKKVSTHQDWVNEAMKYAEKKGVLLVHGAGNFYDDADVTTIYPTKHLSPTTEITNFITVGSSDPEGNPAITSNYGCREVDVFAPGVNIYSTVSGDNYKKLGGTSMACPMVTGVAALLMTYYPELTAVQVKDILIRTAKTHGDANVLKPQKPTLAVARKIVPFSELCVSGGIVNAYEALKMAAQVVGKKSK